MRWSVLVCVIILLVSPIVLSASSPTRYTVVDLGPVVTDAVGTVRCDLSINNLGDVLVWTGADVSGQSDVRLWTAGATTYLGDLLATGHGLNDARQIVGILRRDGYPSGVVEGGASRVLGAGGALDINNSGVAVGCLRTDMTTPLRALVWDGGKATEICHGNAMAINDSGTVVGTLFRGDEMLSDCTAYIWEKGQLTELSQQSGTYGSAINNQGQVLGQRRASSGLSAFIWEGGRFTDLPSISSAVTETFPGAINDSGTAVGSSSVAGKWSAVVWSDGQAYDLNDLVPPSPTRHLIWAHDINNSGSIVASGTSHTPGIPDTAYLLVPGDGSFKRWSGLAMVSIPLIPRSTDPREAVGYAGNYWFRYDAGAGIYKGYPDPYTWLDPAAQTPGRGFWAKFSTPTVVPLGHLPPQDQPVTIHLSRGWNLIGQPFISPLDWDTSAIKVKTSDGSIRPLGSAGDAMLPYGWGWRQNSDDPYKGAYYFICEAGVDPNAAHSLQPWCAYWVKARKDCDLILPPP